MLKLSKWYIGLALPLTIFLLDSTFQDILRESQNIEIDNRLISLFDYCKPLSRIALQCFNNLLLSPDTDRHLQSSNFLSVAYPDSILHSKYST